MIEYTVQMIGSVDVGRSVDVGVANNDELRCSVSFGLLGERRSFFGDFPSLGGSAAYLFGALAGGILKPFGRPSRREEKKVSHFYKT